MITITKEAGEKTTFYLTAEEGAEIRRLIEEIGKQRLTSHCHTVGLSYTNVANHLNGNRKVSIATLKRLLAPLSLDIKCTVVVKTIEIVEDADCGELEEVLFSEAMENVAEEQ